MTTLLKATQRYSVNLEGYVVLDATGPWVRFADIEQAIAQELAYQTADTNLLVSQKTAETVDKDCGNCKKFSTNSLTGGPVCISCKDYSNWEPKP